MFKRFELMWALSVSSQMSDRTGYPKHLAGIKRLRESHVSVRAKRDAKASRAQSQLDELGDTLDREKFTLHSNLTSIKFVQTKSANIFQRIYTVSNLCAAIISNIYD